mgnify:CR=1 FL=1
MTARPTPFTHFGRALTAGILAATLVGTAATAHANPIESLDASTDGNVVTRTMAVNTADLDLANPADAKTLAYRINAAARSVCGPAPSRSLNDQMAYGQCFSKARNSGHQAMVTLVAQAQQGDIHLGKSIAVATK